jgi:hypothetical protein
MSTGRASAATAGAGATIARDAVEMGSWDEAERELRERIESVRVRERELEA